MASDRFPFPTASKMASTGKRMNAKALALTLGFGCLSLSAATAAQPVPTGPIITDPVYTKADQLVDVGGGRRLNLHCRGNGSPTVVFACRRLGDAELRGRQR